MQNLLPINFWKPLLIFFTSLLIYFISSNGNGANYNYFTLLSYSFLHGHLDVFQHPEWLNELVKIEGLYYVVYPPMPAILLAPFIALFGSNFPQPYFSILLGSLNVSLVFIMLKKLNFNGLRAFIGSIIFGFGSNYWYLTTVGSAWFLAHVVAIFFLLLALIESFHKKRLLLIGLLIGASFWSRTTVILTTPFFLIYLHWKFWPINSNHLKNLVKFSSGILFFVILDSLYNYIRFNQISPLYPYQILSQLTNDPAYRGGFINLSSIPLHLNAMFLRLPSLVGNSPYLLPSLYSDAIWFTTPTIFYALFAQRNILNLGCLVGIISTLAVIMLWPVVGYAQFGYRFAMDFFPLLLILIISGIRRVNPITYILVILSIVINFWGIYLINYKNLWVF